MANVEDLRRENATLRARLAGLNQAALRIGHDLELQTVLQEVLGAARELTGATRGMMTTHDDQGEVREFLSSGLSQAERGALVTMSNGSEFFSYLKDLREPLRGPSLSDHFSALGLGELVLPVGSFLLVPIPHLGRHLGSVYVSDKEDGADFSEGDEETLSLFASQAAMAISNARRLSDERRARSDLETLIDTSPIGVVLFDFGTGSVTSMNREARRMLEGLIEDGQSPEQVLQGLTYRRADGREMQAADFTSALALISGETLRAEEIVLRAPGGRSVTAIVNATLIRSEDDQFDSVVITLQDLAALEELERMRAEFLGMVSHELRAPLSSIKGSATTLIESGETFDPAAATQFHRIIAQQADHMQGLITDLLDVARIESGQLVVQPELVNLADLIDSARLGFLGGGMSHEVQIDLPDDLPRVTADRRRILQVLLNLLGNAARHSPETLPIRISAQHEGVEVTVCVSDDGEGIEPERLPQLFTKFTRRGERLHSGAAASGLGLAISRGIIEAHGGRIWAESEGPGRGARFSFTLPAMEAPEAVAPAPTLAGPRRGRRNRVRILTVDDDPQTLRFVREELLKAGFEPILTGDPDAVSRLIAEHRPHLVLLDLILPEIDGVELMQLVPQLRERPVIFISAYGGDARISRALEQGADDYIVKPFSSTELVARIQTVLRRWTLRDAREPTEPYRLAALTINYPERLVLLDGQALHLTALEYGLLADLSSHAGRVRTHDELLRAVWGAAHLIHKGPVRTIVKQLRQKLGDNADEPTYIFNVPRVGYRMPKPEAESTDS